MGSRFASAKQTLSTVFLKAASGIELKTLFRRNERSEWSGSVSRFKIPEQIGLLVGTETPRNTGLIDESLLFVAITWSLLPLYHRMMADLSPLTSPTRQPV